jgi:hypothetical protein
VGFFIFLQEIVKTGLAAIPSHLQSRADLTLADQSGNSEGLADLRRRLFYAFCGILTALEAFGGNRVATLL